VKLKYVNVHNKRVGDKTYCFLVGFYISDHYIRRKFKSCPISRSTSEVTEHTNMWKCTESWTRDLWAAFPVHRNQYFPTGSALV